MGKQSGNGNEVCRSLGTMLFHLFADWCIVFVNRHWTPSFLYLLSLKKIRINVVNSHTVQ